MPLSDRFGSTTKKRRPGRAKGVRISVAAPEQITALIERYQLTGTILTWRDLRDAMYKKTGKRMGLGTLHDLGDGKEPREASLRKALGFPELGEGRICPVHGKVCAVIHRLPSERPAKPRRQWKPLAGKLRAALEKLMEDYENVIYEEYHSIGNPEPWTSREAWQKANAAIAESKKESV